MSQVKVFVGSLPQGISEEALGAYLAPHGQIVSMLCKPEQRYAFVFFQSVAEAQQAVSTMNGMLVEGQTIVAKLANNQGAATGAPAMGGAPAVAWAGNGQSGMAPQQMQAGRQATPGERIYIKGLPYAMTDQSLHELFSGYGVVADAKVLVADGMTSDGAGQSVGIVRMGSLEEAQWVVENLNGNIPQGCERPVDVSFAGARGQNGSAERGPSPYGAGAGMQQQQRPTSPMMSINQPPPPPGGQPARQLAMSGNGFGAPMMAQQKTGDLHPSAAMIKTQTTPGCKLYVKGLPPHADSTYLYKVFSPWGRVVEAVALPKADFCIGFVTYMTDQEAMEGINNVNGQPLLDGASLLVSVKAQRP